MQLSPAPGGRALQAFFTEANVKQSAQESGVYLLYRASRLIYVGIAAQGDTILACLLAHHGGDRGACTQAATEFEYEMSANPAPLRHRHLSAYAERNAGQWPECNMKTRQTLPGNSSTE